MGGPIACKIGLAANSPVVCSESDTSELKTENFECAKVRPH